MRISQFVQSVALLLAACFALAVSSAAQTAVLTQHNDNARTGLNPAETILSTANVNVNQFGKVLSLPVDGQVYAQPLYVPNVRFPDNTTRNVLVVATENDSVYAFDAGLSAGANTIPLWTASLVDTAHGAAPGETPLLNSSSVLGCTALTPEVGITSTPVVDVTTTPAPTIYVEAKSTLGTTYIDRLHALDITTGYEKSQGPVVIAASVSGNGEGSQNGTLTFDSHYQFNRPGLLLLNGNIYIAFATICYATEFHGWIFAYDSSSFAQKSVFLDTPNGVRGGIWMSGSGLAADANGYIYTATGDGTFDTTIPLTDFGDSILKLSTTSGSQGGASLSLSDYFTPYDQSVLLTDDTDLGSGGVMLLPDQTGAHPHLLVANGKEGRIYLIDRDQLTSNPANPGQPEPYCAGCSSNPQIVQESPFDTGGVWGSPAYWNNNVYYWGVGDVLRSFPLSNGALNYGGMTTNSKTFGYPSPVPAVSSNGTVPGSAILWAIDTSAFSKQGPAVLYAFDAANVSNLLWSSAQAPNSRDQAGNAVKFATPTIANGKVYVGASGEVDVYGLLPLITPLAATLGPGQTQQFSLNGQISPNQGVTWSISSVVPADDPGGSFSSATPGLYTAPSVITEAETVTVAATLANGTTGTATINLIPAGSSGGGTGTAAAFVSPPDTTTEGNWQGKYGADGYVLAPSTAQLLPAYASFAVHSASNWTWDANTTDPRALQVPGSTGHVAAAWYGSSSFTFDVNFTDGLSHPFSLYALDWDNKGRAETVQIYDATSSQTRLLDQESISHFTNGIYLAWDIQGHVTIRVTPSAGPNAVVSGVFFGPGTSAAPAPALSITKTHVGNFAQNQQSATYTVTVSNAATASATNGQVTVTEMPPAGLALVSMGGNGWTCGSATCARSDALNPNTSYPPITVTVNVAGNASSPQVNQVSVSGGGSVTSTVSDWTTITTTTGVPALITATSGTPQSAGLGTAFATPFQVTVLDAQNDLVAGVPVTFTAPASGTTGTFAGGLTAATVTTDSQGVATAPLFTANSTAGPYTVTASVPGAVAPAVFYLANVTGSGGSSSATFLGVDQTTQGSWMGVYGQDGYSLASDGNFLPGGVKLEQLPSYVQSIAPSGNLTYVWAYPSTLLDSRALQIDTFGDRMAETWYNVPSFTIDLNLTGAPQRVAFYAVDYTKKARVESLQIVDADTNAVLDTESISNFTGGAYFVWMISGHVTIQVLCDGGENAVISGVFFGGTPSSNPVSVRIAPQIISLSGNQSQQFTAQVSGTADQGVSWSYSPAVGTLTTDGLYTAPDAVTPQTVFLTATSLADKTRVGTAIVNLRNGAVANFVRSDAATQGNWQGVYGSQGYFIDGDSQSVPAYASFDVVNGQSHIWASNTTDVRALQTGSGSGRIAAAWTGTTGFSLNVNFTDGQSHPFALYALDWDKEGRVETVQILDAATNAQLDSRTLANFGNGTYLLWNISGHVTINVTFSSGVNAVISGVFFGTAPASSTPVLSVTKTHVGSFTPGQQNATYTVTVSNALNAPSTSGPVNVSETVPSGLKLVSMEGSGWTCAVDTSSCTRSDALGGGSSYPPVIVTVNVAADASSPQVNRVSVSGGGSASANAIDSTTISAVNAGGASAVFLTQDVKTQGSWETQYGADGYSLANSAQNLPAYDPGFAVRSAQAWTWVSGTTDARALQIPGSSGRIAAAWYNASSFSLDVNTGTAAHLVALYVLDWDNKGRSETIQILDANSSAVLDTQSISNFSNGDYLIWNVTGHVTITVTATSGPNAVVSGIFFGSGGSSVTPPAATAVWDGSDVGTQGNWINLYGSEGYSLANAGQSFSIPVTFAVQKQSNWTWAASTTDPRALETDSQGDRIAAAWYSAKPFSFDVNLTDGKAHQVAVYVLNWDNNARGETIQILDAGSQQLLDTRSIPNSNSSTVSANFANGAYLIWTITGHVTINVTNTGSPNAVVSGVFFK